MIPNEVASMLGLCRRAGQVIAGEFAVERALQSRRAALLLISDDASPRTRERFVGLAERAKVACYQLGTREELGHAIGQPPRVVLAVQNGPLARNLAGRLTSVAEAMADPRG